MTTNDAAEDLRHALGEAKDHIWLLNEALAAEWDAGVRVGAARERRATVERIRAAVYKTDPTFQVTAGELYAILDEEAAR